MRPRANLVTDDQLARIVDRQLFVAPFFRLDAQNRKAGPSSTVFPTQLAAVSVGTVRPDAVAVDLDLDTDDESDWVLHHLTHWCDDRAVFWAVRASGGGPGRTHFVAAPRLDGDRAAPFDRDALVHLVDELRAELGASRTQVDVRATLRLLSAPHRQGRERGGLALSAGQPAQLMRTLQRPAVRRCASATPEPGRLTTRQRSAVRLVHAGPTRSETEWAIALMLKRGGASAGDAWVALTDHTIRADLGHSEERGYAWFVTQMWERIHVEVPRTSPRPGRRLYDWSRFALPAARAVRAFWGEIASTQRRQSVEHVAVVAAARVGPSGLTGAPLPVRDLVEDTGLDAKTVREALAELRRQGILVRVRSFDPKRAASSSDEYALKVPDTVLPSKNPTPRSSTPSDAVWLALPRGCLTLYLTQLLTPSATRAPHLLRACGFQFRQLPSTRQLQALTRLQTALTRAGHSPQPTPDALPQQELTRALGATLRRSLQRRHSAERAAFRSLMADLSERIRERSAAWHAARSAAQERERERRRAAQLLWWWSLDPAERIKRSEVYKEAWRNSDSSERASLLRRLRLQRPQKSDWAVAA